MSNAKALESAFVILLFSPPYWRANISLQPTGGLTSRSSRLRSARSLRSLAPRSG